MSDHKDETITAKNAHPKVVPQIITVTNISAKFPYLKKGEYDIWAMEMQNFISSSDLLCWNIVLKGNSAKSMITDNDGNLKIYPSVTAEEHQHVQREEKARTILLSALPDEHMGLEYISFDDLHNKLKFLEIDTKGYSSSSSTLSNAAFVSTARSSQGNLSYQESRNGGYTTTLSISPGSSSSKGSSKSKCSVVDDVIYSFFANHEIDQHLVYEDLDQMNKEEFEEYDLKHQMEMLSIKLVKCINCKQIGHFSRECRAHGGPNSNNYQKYISKEAGKDGSDSKAMVVVDGSIDWDKQSEEGNIEPRSLKNFGMIAGIKIESDADSEGEVVSSNDAIPAGVSIFAGNVAVDAAIVSPQFKTEFALMGLSTEAKWNNSGKTLYKLIDSYMSVRTKRGLGLDKYIGEGELGINGSKFSIFHTNSDELEGQPIYNRFASVDQMKAVPPPLTGNYMPPSNIPDIDESQMV
nr:ribonuclease H-like domain-containing protein [Tanacetum cinerariifolium]